MTTPESSVVLRADIDVARAVVAVRRVAEDIGMRPDQVTRVATAASELARNVIKYAGRGSLLVRSVRGSSRSSVKLEARDRGPGIADVDAALQDHVSTGGTLGLGLPGVRRMMDEFEIDSEPGQGTRVKVALWL